MGSESSPALRLFCSVRAGSHLIDLDVTASALRKGLGVVRDVCKAGGTILFVNTRSKDEVVTRRAAVACGE